MRGEHLFVSCMLVSNIRIIPACAGSTKANTVGLVVRRGSSPHARGAHPRVVGIPPLVGDHPRMRGEHPILPSQTLRGLGIIPACAGSTVKKLHHLRVKKGSSPHARGAPYFGYPQYMLHRDHPRMRGEHFQYLASDASSPRIIPACAGSTSTAR